MTKNIDMKYHADDINTGRRGIVDLTPVLSSENADGQIIDRTVQWVCSETHDKSTSPKVIYLGIIRRTTASRVDAIDPDGSTLAENVLVIDALLTLITAHNALYANTKHNIPTLVLRTATWRKKMQVDDSHTISMYDLSIPLDTIGGWRTSTVGVRKNGNGDVTCLAALHPSLEKGFEDMVTASGVASALYKLGGFRISSTR